MDRSARAEAGEDDKADGRAAVLEAAARAFMQDGYAATSIDDVAGLLGATKGRVYYYYRSKADLFFDVHRESMRQNMEGAGRIALEDAPALDRLERMVRAHALLMMTHLPFQRVSVLGVEMHLAGSTTPRQRKTLNEIVDLRDAYERRFVDVISQGIADGAIRPLDVKMVVRGLLGALNWITVWYRPRAGETDANRERMADELTTYLINGLRRDEA
ncbi:MAG: TetR/AcrR family transcriptional regulator [Alphaproteobacteria bacterium]|nr:TetR/AcrR family transcriptional regulator [Alphaproteobacteria bacterium]MDX5370044.1 TetR/AcrR family transcriptional regulator [Alphaproteobacteria bacterium]MDX5464618.1 TetR/AcrR family transcriptional regulator [Alphaproteobacteria bacterium]